MKAWTTRDGEQIDTKEFFKRWKEGIKNATPMQQTSITMIGGIIVLIGIIWGVIFSAILKQWWLVTILVGSFLISLIGFYGNWQRFQALKKVEAQMKMFEPAREVINGS